jgi:hypothetical protein
MEQTMSLTSVYTTPADIFPPQPNYVGSWDAASDHSATQSAKGSDHAQ